MGMHGGLGPGQALGGFRGQMQTAARAGLPFGGIPPELQDGVEAILATEPEHPPETAGFTRISPDTRPFTLTRFLARHKWALLGSFAVIVIETIATQSGPWLTGRGVDAVLTLHSFKHLLRYVVIFLAAVLFSMVAGRVRLAWTGRVGERMMLDLRVRIFSHLQRLGLAYYTKEMAGRVMTRMTSDVENLQQLFYEGLVNLVVQALTLVVVVGILFSMNVRLAAITVVFVVPVMTVFTLWFRSVSNRAFLVVRERIADVLADVQESLSGVRIVAAHNRQRHNVIRHRNILGTYRDANNYTAKIGAIYGPGTDSIGTLTQVLILFVGGYMVLHPLHLFGPGGASITRPALTVGELLAFVLYVQSFFAPIQQLVQLYNTYQQGRAAVVKLRELFGTEPDPAEAPDAVDLPPAHGDIRFDHVTFGYEPDRPVLHDIDIHIAAGEVFALVGPTGSGKSTLVKLIERFYDPDEGRILIDGRDLRTVTQTSLRCQIGNVPQEPFFFGGSIKDNIAFARPEASDDEIWDACRAVGLDDLIKTLPDGLDTLVHERGVALSSGQRQLLALARAFHARPRLLILDEATSNLDLRTEAKIEHALDVLLEGRTAIIIAHRLTTAMRAHRLGVVEDGRIVELGSHDELTALGGRYAQMYETWMTHTTGEVSTSA
jgi:ATP-binding cassette subfamily B protein